MGSRSCALQYPDRHSLHRTNNTVEEYSEMLSRIHSVIRSTPARTAPTLFRRALVSLAFAGILAHQPQGTSGRSRLPPKRQAPALPFLCGISTEVILVTDSVF